MKEQLKRMSARQLRSLIKSCEAELLHLAANQAAPKHVVSIRGKDFIDLSFHSNHATEDMKRTICGLAIDKDWRDHTEYGFVSCQKCKDALQDRKHFPDFPAEK